MSGKNDSGFNIDDLTSELKNMIHTNNSSMSSNCCIFRVPNILYRHNPQAYEPNAFSIGPFHYNKPHLKATQSLKLKYLQGLVSRISDENPDTILRLITESISEDRELYRECYCGTIDMNMEEFVKVLVLDGCFIIELLRKTSFMSLREEDDPIFATSCMFEFLYHDLILQENQIPWRVLDRLFDLTADPHPQFIMTSLVKLVIRFFEGDSATQSALKIVLFTWSDLLQSKHILDFLRNTMIVPILNRRLEIVHVDFSSLAIPSATALEESGIRFTKPASIPESILDIKFADGVIEIPHLHITEITEPLFRNIISFEQCLPNCEGVVTSYAILMDKLINTTKDMEVLCMYGVVNNWLNIEDATKFFNGLYNDTYVKAFHYETLTVNVNEYCRRRWPRYRRVLVHDYFRHPWAVISIVGVVVLLTLSFLQTIFTITKVINILLLPDFQIYY